MITVPAETENRGKFEISYQDFSAYLIETFLFFVCSSIVGSGADVGLVVALFLAVGLVAWPEVWLFPMSQTVMEKRGGRGKKKLINYNKLYFYILFYLLQQEELKNHCFLDCEVAPKSLFKNQVFGISHDFEDFYFFSKST